MTGDFFIIILIVIAVVAIIRSRGPRGPLRNDHWWPQADDIVRVHLDGLDAGRFDSASVNGPPFTQAYVRHAQKLAGRRYVVSLVPSDRGTGLDLRIVPR